MHRVCPHLHIQGFAQTVHHESCPLIPHWVEVPVDGFAPEHLPTGQLEFDIGITAACKRKGCQFRREQKNATVSGERGVTSPPLSRTARLCPLFSSISSLYIPEPWTDRSGGTAEEHEAPTACQQKSRDYCPTASKRKSVTPSEREQSLSK